MGVGGRCYRQHQAIGLRLLEGTRASAALWARVHGRPSPPPFPFHPRQFSLGFVAPTLVLWRAQVSAARRHAARQPLPDAATETLAGSVYERICARVLHQVDDFGGAAVAVPLAALAGYVASLLVREALRAD